MVNTLMRINAWLFILPTRSCVAVARFQHSRNTDVEKRSFPSLSLARLLLISGCFLFPSLLFAGWFGYGPFSVQKSHSRLCSETLIPTPHAPPHAQKSWDCKLPELVLPELPPHEYIFYYYIIPLILLTLISRISSSCRPVLVRESFGTGPRRNTDQKNI